MGLLKNLFNYVVGRSLSKNNPDLAGFGFMITNAYFDEIKNSEYDFYKKKEKAIKSFKKFCMDNIDFFGEDYLKKIYEYQNLYQNLTPDNCDIIKPKILKFIDEMDFHILATYCSYEVIKILEDFPKEDLKPFFLDNCKIKYKKIKDSIVPTLTLEYWDDYMKYLIENNVNIENYSELKRQLENKIIQKSEN